jgi:hypothetical protein
MIIEDEKRLNLEFFYNNVASQVKPQINLDPIQAFLDTYQKIEDSTMHTQLNLDLMEHHW